jgi:hypothetical protein
MSGGLAFIAACALAAVQAGTALAAINTSSIVTRKATATVAAGASAAATAHCPTNYLVETGGAYWHPTTTDISDPALNAYLRSSAPLANLTGWYATGANATGQTMNLTTIVRCVPQAQLGSHTLKTREVTVDPGRPGNADLHCGSGQTAIAGGGVWHKPGATPKPGLAAYLTSNILDQGFHGVVPGWTVAGWNASTTILDLRVSVLCVGTGVLATGFGGGGSGSSQSYGATAEEYHSCGGSLKILSGGVSWGYSDGTVDTDTRNEIESSSPTADGSAWYDAVRFTDARRQGTYEFLNSQFLCIA